MASHTKGTDEYADLCWSAVTLLSKHDARKALVKSEAAIELSPERDEAYGRALQAIIYLPPTAGRLRQGKAYLEKLQELKPNAIEYDSLRKRFQEIVFDTESRVTAARKAARLSPDSASVQLNLAQVLLKVECYYEARRVARKLLAGTPQPRVFWVLGVIALELGHLEEAEKWLREAMRRAPNPASCIEKLGVVLHRRGRTAEAAALYREFLALDSSALAPDVDRLEDSFGEKSMKVRLDRLYNSWQLAHNQELIQMNLDEPPLFKHLNAIAQTILLGIIFLWIGLYLFPLLKPISDVLATVVGAAVWGGVMFSFWRAARGNFQVSIKVIEDRMTEFLSSAFITFYVCLCYLARESGPLVKLGLAVVVVALWIGYGVLKKWHDARLIRALGLPLVRQLRVSK